MLKPVTKQVTAEWWETLARMHAKADKDSGRQWVCACAACKRARLAAPPERKRRNARAQIKPERFPPGKTVSAEVPKKKPRRVLKPSKGVWKPYVSKLLTRPRRKGKPVPWRATLVDALRRIVEHPNPELAELKEIARLALAKVKATPEGVEAS